MIRITDQYFWNVIFSVFFVLLVIMGAIILETEARIAYTELTITDFTLITLATWRLIRLFVYDHITKWFREQFWDVKKVGKGYTLEKPKFGPRRTVADLLSVRGVLGSGLRHWLHLVTSLPRMRTTSLFPRDISGSIVLADPH
jgi:hypothetical protein